MAQREVVKLGGAVAQREVVKLGGAEPKFIAYLLNPNTVHDTYFIVGKKKTRIGAVRKMLAAHSEVLRFELEDSQLAEKGDIYLKDISPEALKNLLRYVYGYNNISMLTFDEADDLLYAADKYLIQDLKDQLAIRLMGLLNCQNICSLLNNPACHTVLELDAKITEILQYETAAVFQRPEFVNLRVEAFVKILEQDELSVTELEIWRAALKWAKTQARSQDGPVLRKYISQLKHIRIHTIEMEDLCREVVPSYVLSDKEVVELFASRGKGTKPPIFEGFSDKTNERFLEKGEEFNIITSSTTSCKSSSFTIQPSHDIELLPFEIKANGGQSSYHCDCTIDVKGTNVYGSFSDHIVTVKFNKKVNCGQIFKVPLPTNCRKLLCNRRYKITFTFGTAHPHYLCCQNSYSSKSFYLYLDGNGYNYSLPFKTLKYKCVSK